jgi:hypothetical protein
LASTDLQPAGLFILVFVRALKNPVLMRTEHQMMPKQQKPKNLCRVLVTELKFFYKAAAAGAPPDAMAPANRSGSSSLQLCNII